MIGFWLAIGAGITYLVVVAAKRYYRRYLLAKDAKRREKLFEEKQYDRS